MSVIVITGFAFSGRESVARHVAESCGYRIVDSQIVIERAAAMGASHEELEAALTKPPRVVDRLLHKRRIQLILLHCAAAEEIEPGNVVCHGSAADLLAAGPRCGLRIQVRAPLEFRIAMAWERLRLSREEAIWLIRRLDRNREDWFRSVHGADCRNPSLSDVLTDLEQTPLAEAREIAAHLARDYSRLNLDGPERTVRRDLALSCGVKARLALSPSTAHLNLETRADNGRVSLAGRVAGTEEFAAVQGIALQVPGTRELDTEDIRMGSSDGFGVSLNFTQGAAGRPAWATFALILALTGVVLACSWGLAGLGSRAAALVLAALGAGPRNFVGIITDTKCGGKPDMDADCVRTCVRRGNAVQYALYDGKALYRLELGDPSLADRYAARPVRIRGVLERSANAIRVDSIDLETSQSQSP